MSLLKLLKSEAVQRGLVDPGQDIDARIAFILVRDMPYQRASSFRFDSLGLAF